MMMKQLLIAALVASAHAALFIQQSDFGAQFTYSPASASSPLGSALFTDGVNGIAPSGVNAFGNYNPYGIRYYNGESRGFAPTGDWLLVTDPISHNYGDYSSPIFTIPTLSSTAAPGSQWSVLEVPRNPYTTFHAVVVAAGPLTRWTSVGDIVIFQPNKNVSADLLAYNPLDLFSFQLGTGASSIITSALAPPAILAPPTTTSIGAPLNWVCLGQQTVLMNLAGDMTSFLGAAASNPNNAFRTRGAYCLVKESDVVALVDIAPDSGYPSAQRSLVNRLDALHSEPTEFGLTTLA